MQKKITTNIIFFDVIIVYFTILSILHFIRLTFSWEIIIKGAFGEQLIPSYASGFCIILSIIIILRATNIISRAKNRNKKIEEEFKDKNL